MVDEKPKREREFREARFGGDDSSRGAARKFYSLMPRAQAAWRNRIASLSRGKRILELGCATGGNAEFLAQLSARVTGIDISHEGIARAAAHAREEGIQADYLVMNAGTLQFEDGSFDAIVGTSILHHLELDKAYAEMARVLSPNGHVVLLEPLGHNFLVNLYGRLTPSMRTVDEHRLLMKDIRRGEEYFARVEAEFFNLSTFLAMPLRATKQFGIAFRFLSAMDEMLFRALPFLKRCAWLVVLDMSRPQPRE